MSTKRNQNQSALQLVRSTDDAIIEEPTKHMPPIQSAVDLPFEERLRLLKLESVKAGLRLPDTRLPEGHALWDVGVKAQRKLASEISKLPNFMDASNALLGRIQQEDLLDLKDQEVPGFIMDPTSGRIYGDGDVVDGKPPHVSEMLGYTNPGFDHMIQFLKPATVYGNPSSFLLTLSPKSRAQVFNELTQQEGMDKRLVTIRTMVEPISNVRTIRAVTSNKHSLSSGDDAAVLQSVMENQTELVMKAKARLTREHHRSEFELIWPSMDRELVVGDIAYIFVRISNSEVKEGSLRVEVGVLRVLCANFTTAFSTDDKAETISIRHIGDLRTKLVEGLKRAVERAEPFVRLFADAYQKPFPGVSSQGEGWTRADILTRTRKALLLPETTVLRAGELWDADGVKSAGNTLAGLVNAVTRASQELETEKAAEVERAAGRLINEGWSAIGIV